jgi:hypothetical protein
MRARRRAAGALAPAAAIALMLAAAGCGSKSQRSSVLLSITSGVGAPIPDELRLNVYNRFGRAFPQTRLPAEGPLVPLRDPLLGTIVIYVDGGGGELRIEAQGLMAGRRVSQGALRVSAPAGRQDAVDLILEVGALPDGDGDLVPAAIDNCVEVVNADQDDGVGDACQHTAELGAPCAADTTCVSGLCVDGVCCSTPCAETCHSCNVAGMAGTCVALAEGEESRADCPPETISTCGRTGRCAAGGACARYSDGQICVPAACAGSMQRAARTCDGAGACRETPATSCGIFGCAGDICATTCSGDSQCAAGYYCIVPDCVPQLDDGATCSAAGQCRSRSCTDGVCCATACVGQCMSCGGVTPGTCVNHAAGSDPDGECAQGLACTGMGACFSRCTQDNPDCESGYYCSAAGACTPKKAVGMPCGAANECQSTFCTDGVCCVEACTEVCKSCNLAGQIGACTFVPDGDRDPGGPNACGPPRRCDGAGTCG